MSFLSGEPMPVIESLIESYRKYSDGLEELGHSVILEPLGRFELSAF